MIAYLEEFLGLAEGSLSNSDFGIMLSMILALILIFAIFKAIFGWFETLFSRS